MLQKEMSVAKDGFMEVEDNLHMLDTLEKVCKERGIEIKQSDSIQDGDIIYLKRFRTIFLNKETSADNVKMLQKYVYLEKQ